MILLNSVTENISLESFFEVSVVGLLKMGRNLINVFGHKNDKVVPFLVN